MSRYYNKNGIQLPSVTTITGQMDKSGPLTYWAANCACDYILEHIQDDDHEFFKDDILNIVEQARKNFRKVSKAAMDIGSQVHGAIETYLKTGKEPYKPPNEVLAAFLAFLEWKDQHKLITIETEHSVYGYNYAGTCDLICYLDDIKYLIDFKAAKAIYPEYKYQVAGYRATDNTIKGCGILRLDKESGYPEWKDTSGTYEQDIQVFAILTNLWWATHPKKKQQFDAAIQKLTIKRG